jgi:cytochrome c
MRLRRALLPILALQLAALALTACDERHNTEHPPVTEAPLHLSSAAPNTLDFYQQNVRPILQTNCFRCHANMNHRGGLNMETRDALIRGGKYGSALDLNQPDQSLMLKLIRHEGTVSKPMPPPPRLKLSDADIAIITAWVKAGAPMPPPTN